jgi:hypothetical protein
MTDRGYWQKELREAEAELEAARKPTEVKAAAKRLQRARAELKVLEDVPAKPAKRRRATKRKGRDRGGCCPKSPTLGQPS